MFRLELTLDPQDAPRLARLRALAGRRIGRPRTQRAQLTWLDTPDGALAATGRALRDGHGRQVLEQIRPDGIDWPPGVPPPVVADPADMAALPGPLMPWAALEGRLQTLILGSSEGGGGTISLGILTGTLRSVQAERAACRLLLEGEEPAVLALARTLAGELRAEVPGLALADEAMAAARGLAPVPRRSGAPQLAAGLSVGAGFAAIVGHLTDVLLHQARQATPGAPEPVHQARVALRRLRSAFSLFRRAVDGPAVQAAQAGLKRLGAVLGPARDLDVFTRGLGARVGRAFPGDAALARLLRVAEARRIAAYAALAAYLATPAWRLLAIDLVALAAGRGWHEDLPDDARGLLDGPMDTFAAAVLDRRYDKLLAAGETFDTLPDADLHAVRLLGKRLRYGCEFFAPLYPGKATRRFLHRLARLQERLGLLNDAVVAGDLLAGLHGAGSGQAGAVGLIRGYAAAGAERLRPRLGTTWERFVDADVFWR